MAPTRKQQPLVDHTAEEESQSELEAQLTQLRAQIATLEATNQAARATSGDHKPRVPSGLPKFKGKRDEDVRQWLFQVETLCRIHGHDASDENDTLPSIAGMAMEELASGWFLFWALRTPAEDQTWGQFSRDAISHFEASNYQAMLRQKLGQLRQGGDIEEYNGKYSSLIFRVESIGEVEQVSYYCDSLMRATQAYVKLQNPTELSEAMDQAVKYKMSHFGAERKTGRERSEREQRFRGPPRSTATQDRKPFNKRSYKPGHYAPAEQTCATTARSLVTSSATATS
ncbi:hypothetical protein PHYSODRAFT_258166 [Phytophthora sojae]|uniref:Ty3 transposon capsid-like protein domain-containing protein n=1 Tax=Phytophthora sojae (strain P6497) TaxID=1094619 RepID=G4YMN5_PHYSP|nr:hypothetical protein PHYSODRAFT_258166 [Phytophthora sojae]EGZ28910.1 hypothetical protein PHYSODRAFT_258166 [Phytophthora sojae]|eukprot:XP_009516185.1 hypothetical protein PHYSODRAFT_258166 [Phytophthora sojae]